MSRDSASAYGVDPLFRLEVIELESSTGDSVGNKKRKNENHEEVYTVPPFFEIIFTTFLPA